MSDVLSGLRRRRWPGLTLSADTARLMQRAHNQALDDVREALCNPTDEQVNAAVRATGMTRRDLRRAWAAAAGEEAAS